MGEEYERYKIGQAEAWLRHVLRLGNRCRALRAEIEAQRELASGLRGLDYSSPAVSASPTADTVPNAVSRLLDGIQDYCTELAGYVGEQEAAHKALQRLEDAREAECLTLYYICGYKWSAVAKSMSYSYESVMALRRSGLLHAYDVMPLEWRDPMHPAV